MWGLRAYGLAVGALGLWGCFFGALGLGVRM